MTSKRNTSTTSAAKSELLHRLSALRVEMDSLDTEMYTELAEDEYVKVASLMSDAEVILSQVAGRLERG